MKPNYKFGLILCTVDRDFSYIRSFMKSLLSNTYENWELIIVDQNDGDRLYSQFIHSYGSLVNSGKVKYLRVNFRGLSRARNYGIRHLSEDVDIVAFPDDDCEYPCNLLETVAKLFTNYDIELLTGRSVDKDLLVDSNGRWLKKDSIIKISNVFKTAISYTIFVKRNYLIDFDVRLGAGAGTMWGSAEETDFVYRLIRKGYKGRYFYNLVVYHPLKPLDDMQRVAHYSRGMGAFFKKHFSLHPLFLLTFANLLLIRPLGGIVVNLIRGNLKKANLYLNIFLNRWIGFISWKNED